MMTINLLGGMKADLIYGAKRGAALPAATRASGSASAASGGLLGNTARTVLLVIGVIVLIGLGIAGGFALGNRRSLFR
jgi:hypothetical protein